MIDPRLRSLQLVAWHGTVTAAARTLNYTPSAVSAQLKSLAADVGVELLERKGRRVYPTWGGRMLLEFAEELNARWEQMHGDLLKTTDATPGVLRLCGFSTAASNLLPRVATEVIAAHPGAHVRIIEADPEECFEQHPLASDPLDLLLPKTHPFADMSSVPLADMAHDDWIMDHPGRPHHQLVMTSCLAAGFNPTVAHEIVEWDTGAALVHAGLGVCLIPRLARLPAGFDIVRVPLRGDPSPSRQIRTGIRAGSSTGPLLSTALSVLARLTPKTMN